MGGGGSKISADGFLSGLTRDKLLAATRDPRSMSDAVFSFLRDNIKINTYFPLLGRPDMCNRFVFLLAQDIQKVFEKLPVKVGTRSGVLIFQSIDTLTKKSGVDKEITEKYCQYVASLIARVFQIYSALALSIMDNETVRAIEQTAGLGVQSGVQLGFRTQGGGAQLSPRQGGGYLTAAQEYFPMGYRIGGYGQIGGSSRSQNIEETNRLIDQAFNYTGLTKDSTSGLRYNQIKYAIPNFYVRRMEPNEPQSPNFMFIDGNRHVIEIELIFGTEFGQANYQYKVGLIKIDGEVKSKEVPWTNAGIPVIKAGSKATTSIAEAVLTKIITNNIYNNVIKREYKAVLEAKVGAASEQEGNVYGPRAGSGAASGAAMPTPTSLTGFYDLIDKGVRPLGLCVVRALQLLQTGPGGKPMTAVCQPQVLAKYGGVKSGDAATSHAGLKALNNLFFKVIGGETGELLTAGQSQYETLMKLFIDEKGTQPTKLASAKFKSKKCAVEKQYFISNKDVAKLTRESVEKLIGFQAKHTAVCANIFKMMFNITGQGGVYRVVGLHPKLYSGGEDYVEQIAAIARQALVNYYKYCEETYDMARSVVVDKGVLV
jgi:hypothetical protein